MEKRQPYRTDLGNEPTPSNRGAREARKINGGPGPSKLTGAFERYQQAVAEPRVRRMLEGQSAFSREGPLSAWLVIWLMIFQRLHAKGTLAVAVRELLTGPAQALVRSSARATAEPLSANTSAYSQARSKLPLAVAEQVSDMIFASLMEQPKTLAELGEPMFLLDGSSVLLPHSEELVAAYPPARNQHGVSHWPVMRVVSAHDVVSGLATRPCWGPMYGKAAVSEQGLAKQILGRLPAGCGVLGDRNFGVFSMAYHAREHNHPCVFRLTQLRAGKLQGGFPPPAKTDRRIRWVPSREDRRSNPEIPAEACVEGRLLVFKVPVKGKKKLKLYIFTTLNLPAEDILRLYGYRWNTFTYVPYRDGSALAQTRGATAHAGCPIQSHGGEGTGAQRGGVQSHARDHE